MQHGAQVGLPKLKGINLRNIGGPLSHASQLYIQLIIALFWERHDFIKDPKMRITNVVVGTGMPPLQ